MDLITVNQVESNMEFDVQRTNAAEAGKRGKLIFLSAVITLLLFAAKFSLDEVGRDPRSIVIATSGFFLLTYFGLLWAFKLQVTRKALITIIPQSALYVAAMSAFNELFFFDEFARAFEFIILMLIGGFVFTSTYISFLMTNIFNVNQFKEIPLNQVAKTASYFVTLLTVYFSTYAVLAMQNNFVLSMVVIAVIYTFALLSHYQHIKLTRKEGTVTLINSILSMIVALVAAITFGSHYELAAMLPTSIAFTTIGITMHKVDKNINTFVILEYLAVFIVVLILNMVFNVVT